MLSFSHRLSDHHLLGSQLIKDLARKRVRQLDDSMTEKVMVERDFRVIEEFLRLSMLCGKIERMKKVLKNFIIGKIPEAGAKDGI